MKSKPINKHALYARTNFLVHIHKSEPANLLTPQNLRHK